MNIETELAQLQEELAALRKDVAVVRKEQRDLHRFVTIEHDEESGEPTNLNLRCCILTLAHPDAPNRTQCFFMAGPEGPYLTFLDSHEKARLTLSLEKDAPEIRLMRADGKDAVVLSVDEKNGSGCVGVLEAGKPRAIMRTGNNESGVVSVCHDDGQPRMILRSEALMGEILGVSPDMKVTVRIQSGAPAGGLLALHGVNGKASVIVSSTQLCGAVIVNDPQGNRICSLPPVEPQAPPPQED